MLLTSLLTVPPMSSRPPSNHECGEPTRGWTTAFDMYDCARWFDQEEWWTGIWGHVIEWGSEWRVVFKCANIRFIILFLYSSQLFTLDFWSCKNHFCFLFEDAVWTEFRLVFRYDLGGAAIEGCLGDSRGDCPVTGSRPFSSVSWSSWISSRLSLGDVISVYYDWVLFLPVILSVRYENYIGILRQWRGAVEGRRTGPLRTDVGIRKTAKHSCGPLESLCQN